MKKGFKFLLLALALSLIGFNVYNIYKDLSTDYEVVDPPSSNVYMVDDSTGVAVAIPSSDAVRQVNDDDGGITAFPTDGSVLDWISWALKNMTWLAGVVAALITFLDIIARETPTEKDNNFLRRIQDFLDKFIPNKRLGGGFFEAYKSSKKDSESGG